VVTLEAIWVVTHQKARTYRKGGAGKNFRRAASPELSVRTEIPGLRDFQGLARMSNLFEDKQSNYILNDKKEEKRLFEVNYDIRTLLQNLESKDVLESGNNEET
jgi:hypothetical protein